MILWVEHCNSFGYIVLEGALGGSAAITVVLLFWYYSLAAGHGNNAAAVIWSQYTATLQLHCNGWEIVIVSLNIWCFDGNYAFSMLVDLRQCGCYGHGGVLPTFCFVVP